jgi:hypothetical protein
MHRGQCSITSEAGRGLIVKPQRGQFRQIIASLRPDNEMQNRGIDVDP